MSKKGNIGWLILVFLSFSSHLSAGDLSVEVKNARGKSALNAVVTLKPLFEADWSAMPPKFALMKQRNALFQPFVLAVKTDTPVSFPNFDEFRHQVYSFSKAKRFELRLYGKDESKKIVFDKAGLVSLGCNIHDNMLAYIYVTEDPYFLETDENGAAVFEDVRPGAYEMTVWHPDQLKRKVSYKENITLTELDSEIKVSIKMRRVKRVQKPADEDTYGDD